MNKLQAVRINMTQIEKSKESLETFYAHVRKKAPHVTDVTQVLVGPAMYKKLLKLLTRDLRKECKWMSKSKQQLSVGMNWLNYGPVQQEGIADGYVLVREIDNIKE